MRLKKMVLDVVLKFFQIIVLLLPINKNKIAFVSLENKVLDSDLKLIYEKLEQESYQLVCVLTKFDRNNLWTNFCYFLNTIKQLFVINTSALVIINDNNYVISKYKRTGVKVLQIWHAAGAIKKFGNTIERSYFIDQYDYVICNGDFWKPIYSIAFHVEQSQVISIGMPRLDHLLDKSFLDDARHYLYIKYPILENKKIILYAPTFRGNIYDGVKKIPIDFNKILSLIDTDYVVLYKLHPLLKQDEYPVSNKVINMNGEDLHRLFSITDILVSDFSSIIFDFSLLNKTMFAYVPDLDNYMKNRGCFINYKDLMKDKIAYNEFDLAQMINSKIENNASDIKTKYLSAIDGNALEKNISLIKKIMQNESLSK